MPNTNWQFTNEPPPLLEEIQEAIKDLKIGKSPGNDQVTAEMIKYGGEKVAIFYHRLCTKIWQENIWPDEWGESIFVPIPKKGDILQCSNNRTISLISHSSKILLKIIAMRMASKLSKEIAEEQAGFRPGKGTRDQIMNLKMILEKNRERGIDICLCFIDYSKAFDMVAHDILWNDMYSMGFPTHIILLLKSLYLQQKAAVRTTYGMTDWFDIEQGVRQGCIISPHLFNIYSETIMRKALENHEGSIKVGGHNITNLRYADDVVLIAGSMDELQNLVNRVKTESEKAGLLLNAKKTKVMKIQRTPTDEKILIDRTPIENVTEFSYLGATFTTNGDDSKEIRKRIGIAKNATTALTNIWKDRNISLRTKKRLLQSLVFSIASYGSECWVLKSTDRKRIDGFEMWCYRRVLRISWIEKKTNEEVLQKINIQRRLLNILDERKLSFIGHQMRKPNSLEKRMLIGAVYG